MLFPRCEMKCDCMGKFNFHELWRGSRSHFSSLSTHRFIVYDARFLVNFITNLQMICFHFFLKTLTAVSMNNVNANLLLRNFHKLLGQVPSGPTAWGWTVLRPPHIARIGRRMLCWLCGSTGFHTPTRSPRNFASVKRASETSCERIFFADSFFVRVEIVFLLLVSLLFFSQ